MQAQYDCEIVLTHKAMTIFSQTIADAYNSGAMQAEADAAFAELRIGNAVILIDDANERQVFNDLESFSAWYSEFLGRLENANPNRKQ